MPFHRAERRATLLFFLLVLWSVAFGSLDRAQIGTSLSGLIIDSASVFTIPPGTVAPQGIPQGTSDQLFVPVSEFSETQTGESHDHWLKLYFRSTSAVEKTWVLDFESWTDIEAFVPSDGTIERLRSGHLVPFRERSYREANRGLIALKFEPLESKVVYLHLQSSINFLQVPANLHFNVYSETDFRSDEMGRRVALGLFAGFYIIMLLYNLFIYISTKDRNYIPYLIALLAALFLTFHNAGYTVAIFQGWDEYVHLHSKMQFFLSQILGTSMLVFAAWFLDVKQRYPRHYTVLKILLVAILFLPLPSLLGYASINEKISGLLGILTMAFILNLAIRSYLHRYPSSGLFLIGYGAFALGIVVILSTFIGVLPVEVQNYYPMNIGSTIEMVFFSLALGNRINVLAKDNEEKQREIIKQLEEKEELQANINRELEIKVVERTREIEYQKVLIEDEKEKSESLLLNILPVPIAKELKEKGTSSPKSYDHVSVMFADLVGFTTRAEKLSPEVIITELDHCFRAFDDIVEKYGLEKIKTIGDGYMCAGGVPVPMEDNPIRVVRAGMEMQQFMNAWADEKKAQGEQGWRIRVGIHTGEVMAGVVGRIKFAYDIWGDTVNTASRIETACEPGRVNISGSTRACVGDEVEVEYRGEIFVKDKVVDMYYVQAVNTTD